MKKLLPLKKKIGYGICDVGGNAFFTLTSIWLMFYFTDIVGLSPMFAGLALLIGKIFDAVIDPFIGIISDRTRTKIGRRRPYMLVGALSIIFTMIFLFKKPTIETQGGLLIWAITAYCLACLSYSLITIPYFSLTPEITSDYDERTSLNGVRMIFSTIGLLLAAIFFLPIVEKAHSREIGYMTAGIIYGVIIMASALVTFFMIKEKEIKNEKIEKHSINEIIEAFKNKPFLIISLVWVLNITGITFLQAIQQYYFKYIFNSEMLSPVALVVLMVTALLLIPVWVKISNKFGKKSAYSAGLLIVALAVILIFFFGHIIMIPGIFFLQALAGVGLSSTLVIPWAIIPDTIEYDVEKTNKRKEGIYYGIWTFLMTLGGALAVGIMGGILQKFGYVANAVSQTGEAQLGIRINMGIMPAIFLIAGAIIIHFYPITKEKYNEIISKIKK